MPPLKNQYDKNYCKYCKTWTQGDKISVRRHEQSNHHKNRVKWFIRDGSRRKEKEDREQQQLNRELSKIGNAAARQVGIDRPRVHDSASGSAASSSSNFPFKKASASHFSGANHEPLGVPKPKVVEVEEIGNESDEEVVAQHQVLGQYTEEGVVYLQGRWHEDILAPGRKCQVMPPDSDDWTACVIQNRSVSHKSSQAEVEYTVILLSGLDMSGGNGKSVTVECEDLRIAAPPAPPKPLGFDTVAAARKQGFGVWESVAANSDEEEKELNIQTETNNATQVMSLKRRQGEDGLDFAMRQARELSEMQRAQAAGYDTSHPDYIGNATAYEGDDSYSAANPFGGTYRGYEMPEEDSMRVVSAVDNAGAAVSATLAVLSSSVLVGARTGFEDGGASATASVVVATGTKFKKRGRKKRASASLTKNFNTSSS